MQGTRATKHRRPGLRAGAHTPFPYDAARKQTPREQCPPVAMGPGSEAGTTAENIFRRVLLFLRPVACRMG